MRVLGFSNTKLLIYSKDDNTVKTALKKKNEDIEYLKSVVAWRRTTNRGGTMSDIQFIELCY